VGDKACSTSMMKGKRVQELLMLHAFIAGKQRYSVKNATNITTCEKFALLHRKKLIKRQNNI